MAKRSPTVPVSPAVLAWARTASGRTLTIAAEALKLRDEDLAAWERGPAEIPLPLSLLRKMADLYHRSVATLLLDRPPAAEALPPDYRIAGPVREVPPSPPLALAIQRSRRLLRIASELFEDLRASPGVELPLWEADWSPERASEFARVRLEVDSRKIRRCRDAEDALLYWRREIERLPVLVFRMDFRGARVSGLSLRGPTLGAITLNRSDAKTRQVFTLTHELAHLTRGGGGICDAAADAPTRERGEERLCDEFAAAFLLPANDFMLPAQALLRGGGLLRREDLVPLAVEFRVSPEVALRRCLTLGLLGEDRFRDSLRLWPRILPRAGAPVDPGEFRTTGAILALGSKGRKFVDVVLDAYGAGIIGVADAASFIGVRLVDLDRLQGHSKPA